MNDSIDHIISDDKRTLKTNKYAKSIRMDKANSNYSIPIGSTHAHSDYTTNQWNKLRYLFNKPLAGYEEDPNTLNNERDKQNAKIF